MGSEADHCFEEFVRGRSTHLFRLALVLTSWNEAAAQDLLQIALERAYRRRVRGADSVGIVITPDGKTAYVLNDVLLGFVPSTVTPVRTATNTALTPIRVGRHPEGIAVTPDSKTVYVANYLAGTVTPIQAATGKALKPIKVGGYRGPSRSPPTARPPAHSRRTG